MTITQMVQNRQQQRIGELAQRQWGTMIKIAESVEAVQSVQKLRPVATPPKYSTDLFMVPKQKSIMRTAK